MQYQGGKAKSARRIAAAIRNATRATRIHEPFMGGASVTCALAPLFEVVSAGDANPALIAMWRAARDGWRPELADITREQFQAAKALPDSDPLKALILVGCSFGGRWGTSPAIGPNSDSPNTYAQIACAHIARQGALLDKSCVCLHAQNYTVALEAAAPGEAVYCDPPYADTAGYGGPMVDDAHFSHEEFWALCEATARRGVDVFVSEYTIPAGVPGQALLTLDRAVTVAKNDNRAKRVEFLWHIPARA